MIPRNNATYVRDYMEYCIAQCKKYKGTVPFGVPEDLAQVNAVLTARAYTLNELNALGDVWYLSLIKGGGQYQAFEHVSYLGSFEAFVRISKLEMLAWVVSDEPED